MLAVGLRASALALLSPATTSPASGTAGTSIPWNGTASTPLVRVAGPARLSISFGTEGPDPTQMKLHLYEQAGHELGVDMSKFSSLSDYGAALKAIVGQIRFKPGGDQILTAISHKLGLDKLGVSLDTLIGSIDDPESRSELDAALTASTATHTHPMAAQLGFDAAGAYRRIG